MPDTKPAITLSPWDLGVIAFFFVFMAGIGWLCRRMAGNQSEYFRGGGRMLWWLVGATAFMTQFSAVTFTGMAGKAYNDGMLVFAIFWGNALGYYLNAAVTAVRFRRMRVITSYEAVRERFGALNEQVFTWLQIPISIVYGGMWLYGLAIVASSFFGWEMTPTILITGAVVVFISVAGGAWAVIASDFIQMVLLMAVSIIMAVLVFGHPDIGGIGGFIEKVPVSHFDLFSAENARFLIPWIFAAFVQQSFKLNSVAESYRYLCVKDDSNARRAALLAGVLMTVGPIVWFVPPMAASVLVPDIGAALPLLKNPQEGSYILMGSKILPVGMLGLLVCGVLAATMSSMDSALNRNAGIFLRSFYHPVLRKQAGERELFHVGQVASLVAGALTITAALLVRYLGTLDLFEIMTLFGSLIAIPYAMPLFWGVFVRRAPSWAGWSTVLVGFTFSLLANYVLTSERLGFGTLAGREKSDFVYVLSGLGNVFFCTLWFFGTTLFAGTESPGRAGRVEEFFRKLRTPIAHDEEKSPEKDFVQARLLGILSAIYGGFILVLALVIPNPPGGRVAFVSCAAIVGGVGLALIAAARKGMKSS